VTATVRLATSDADFAAVHALQAIMAEWDVAMSRLEGCPAQTVMAAYYGGDAAAIAAAYRSPGAGMLVAANAGRLVGCAAWSPLEADVAELGKVFVLDSERGAGTGCSLVGEALDRMRAGGYRAVRLETASFMHAAIRLYARHGFRHCPFFRPAIPGLAAITVPMERDL
jgi:GNAT superfamily N-acetyltransferase